MDNPFLFSLFAILPIILVIGLGYFLKRINLVSDEFLNGANKLIFKILLPVTLFYNIYNVKSIESIDWNLALFSTVAILAVFGISILIVTFLVPVKNRKGVVVQAAIRSNYSIIGLPLASAIGGAAGVAAASVVMAITIPIFNILAVIALSVYSDDVKVNVKDIIKKIVTNPLIIGVFTGIVFLVFRMVLPIPRSTNDLGDFITPMQNYVGPAYKTIEMVAGLSSAFSLIILGAGFKFMAIKEYFKDITISVVMKNFLIPIIGLGLFIWIAASTDWLTNTPATMAALIPLFGSPTAVSSSIMAKEMGGDHVLASQVVVWSSLMSIISLFLCIFITASMGFL